MMSGMKIDDQVRIDAHLDYLRQQTERGHTDNRTGGAENGFHQRPGLQRFTFRCPSETTKQPEAGIVDVDDNDLATSDINR